MINDITIIGKNINDNSYKIIKFKNDKDKPISPIKNNAFYIYGNDNQWYSVFGLYRWDGLNEPKALEFDKNTGKITNWKE